MNLRNDGLSKWPELCMSMHMYFKEALGYALFGIYLTVYYYSH